MVGVSGEIVEFSAPLGACRLGTVALKFLMSRAGYVDSLFKSLLPDTAANEFGPICKKNHDCTCMVQTKVC